MVVLVIAGVGVAAISIVSVPFVVPAVFVAEMGTAASPALIGIPLMTPFEVFMERFAVATPGAWDKVAPYEVALLLAVIV